ncbi:MAG TPA: SPOR domain-containing protein [Bryobacteraceae bacterium]|nr:SPOR domain-containing protein [Bryobacteraceae bacterium]
MANESLTRNEELVDGRYPIKAEISRLGRSTVYETEHGDKREPAVIKVRERYESEGEAPADRWRSAMGLAHANLLKIYDVGSSTLRDVPVTWAVMEPPDESLEEVLVARPLSAEETREVVKSTGAALRHLHEHGFAHSCLSPSNVLAVGDRIKLSSDSVLRIDGDRVSAEEDMRALGTLIVQVLTQRVPNGHLPGDIPEPFREIARGCLDPDASTRWTAAQVLSRLTKPDVVHPLPNHQLHVQANPPIVRKTPAVEAPAEAPRPQQALNEEPRDKDRSVKKIPNWIYAALIALLAIVFVAAGLRKKDPPAEHVRTPAPATTAQRTPAAQTPAPQPFSATTTPLPPTPAPGVSTAAPQTAEGWSVIVAAYAEREAAEKRMRAMAARWPRFNPTVLHPGTGRTHYIVVLGTNLSQEKADALRKRAVAAGFPRDAYIKNLM